MAKQAITLKIAGKSYPFNIESGKEEAYRLAEREVNSYVALIKQQNIKGWGEQDYLAMAALKFAIANVSIRQSRELDNEDLKHLEKISSDIDTYLTTLGPAGGGLPGGGNGAPGQGATKEQRGNGEGGRRRRRREGRKDALKEWS